MGRRDDRIQCPRTEKFEQFLLARGEFEDEMVFLGAKMFHSSRSMVACRLYFCS